MLLFCLFALVSSSACNLECGKENELECVFDVIHASSPSPACVSDALVRGICIAKSSFERLYLASVLIEAVVERRAIATEAGKDALLLAVSANANNSAADRLRDGVSNCTADFLMAGPECVRFSEEQSFQVGGMVF